jgi:ribonuclease VapC
VADSPVFVLDACALLRVAQAEPGMDAVVERLRAAQRGECRLLLHQINLGEVVYRIGKVHGWAVAERKRSEIGLLPIEVVKFSDTLFWDAVRLKAAYPISYAEAFAAALAMAHEATLLTADPEFEVLGDRVRRLAV